MVSFASLSELERYLLDNYNPIWTEYESFESNAEMLRIHYNGRYFVIALVNANSVWMDEPNEDDGLSSSYRHHFINIASATEVLLRELLGAK